MLSSTYSPEDNKLRLYSTERLDSETYNRVKAEGFSWAPKQQLFVAGMWTPGREDLLLELCGEIGDEDTSLVERAAERAERFSEYQEKRAEDAERAQDAVERITDGIPLGQPILVGHHSERHARKDAERIENGMRRAVKMWETSEYWKRRAVGAIHAAKYKERPDVRYRRIKGLEADLRKHYREKKDLETRLAFWSTEKDLPLEAALTFANYLDRGGCTLSNGETYYSLWGALNDGKITVDEVKAQRVQRLPRSIAYRDRWIQHLSNRIEYERAMLGETGGVVAERPEVNLEVGGRVLIRQEWATILKLNKREGKVVSVKTTARFVSVRGVEEIEQYEPPAPGMTEKVKAATALPPLCNYAGEGFRYMTKAEYEAHVPKWSDFSKIETISANEHYGRHRVRRTRKDGEAYYNTVRVFLTDVKVVEPPKVEVTV